MRAAEVRAAIRSNRHRALELDGKLIELDTTRPLDTAELVPAIDL